jgi:hypothetical protein
MNDKVKAPPAQPGAVESLGTGGTIQPLGLMASDADQAIAAGQSYKISQYVTEQRTGWDGMTEQERQQAEEQESLDDAARLQEYMAENERQYQELMRDLNERDMQVLEQIKKMEDNTYHLQGDDRKAVFVDRFGRFIDANGNLLEGDAKREAEEAKAAGYKFEEWESYKRAKDAHEEIEIRRRELERQHAEHRRVEDAALARGDIKGAQTEAEKDRKLLDNASMKAQDTNTILSEMQVGHDKMEADIAKEDLSAELGLDDIDLPKHASAAITTRNTSLADQLDPVTGQPTIKPEFTAKADPSTVKSGITVAVNGPQRNFSNDGPAVAV